MHDASLRFVRLIVEFPRDPSRVVAPPAEERRALRLRASLTLGYAAWLVGVDTATLSRWERGLVEPHGTRRLVYAALLDRLGAGLVPESDTPPGGTDGASKLNDHGVHGGAYRAP